MQVLVLVQKQERVSTETIRLAKRYIQNIIRHTLQDPVIS